MVDKSGFLFVYFHASLVSWLIGGQTNQTDQAEKACQEKGWEADANACSITSQ